MSGGDDDYARLFALVDEARTIPRDERDAWLVRACGDNAELLEEVRTLLAAGEDDSLEDAFAESKVEAARRALDGIAEDALHAQDPHEAGATWLPDEIGGYRILRQIGQGGMGIVYEAEQSSPHRRVAIKLLHPMHATPERLRRFRQEAAVLGRLQHPGIAQIFEAGTFDVGHGEQPFFAMELVEGVDIRTYCERGTGLERAARVELLARVADAVHYAHEHGVIHRDLKPDNVLVDVRGNPRILDFGIARANSASATLSTIMTEEGQLVGTLAYMSPEQLEQATDAVTPRVDVYALGVLAFELLVGRLPREIGDLSLSRAIALLATSDPPRAGALDTSLRGDLETILGKALESEPARRYASAAALAADLRRHLGHRPILARAPSRFYLARKFSRRHRGLVVGAAATLVTLLAGIVVSLALAARMREQRDLASANAERAALGESRAVGAVLQSAQSLLDVGSAREAVTQLALVPQEARGFAWNLLDRALPVVIPASTEEQHFLDDRHLAREALDGLHVVSLVERGPPRVLFAGEGLRNFVYARTGVATAIVAKDMGAVEQVLVDLEQERVLERRPPVSFLAEMLIPAGLPDAGQLILKGTYRKPAVSEDGRYVLWYASRSKVEVYRDGALLRTVQDLQPLDTVLLAPDGRSLVVNRRTEVTVLDVESGALRFRHRCDPDRGASGTPVVGGLLLRNGWEEQRRQQPGMRFCYFELADSADPDAPLEAVDPFADSVASPFGSLRWLGHPRDGRFLALSAWDSAGEAKLVDAITGAPLEFAALSIGPDGTGGWIRFPERAGSHIDVSPSGQRLAVTSEFAPTRIVELDPRERDPSYDQRVLTLRGHESPGGVPGNGWVYDLAISDDGSLLASSAPMDPHVRVWDTRTGEQLATLERAPYDEHAGTAEALMAFRPGGEQLLLTESAAGGEEWCVVAWDLLSGEVRRPPAPGADERVHRRMYAWFADELGVPTRARLSQRAQLFEGHALVVSHWKAPDASRSGRRWRSLPGLDVAAAGLSLDPRSTLAAVVHGEVGDSGIGVERRGTLSVLDAHSGELHFRRELDYRPWCVAYSPDGETIAVGTHEGHVLLFESTHFTQQLDWRAHEGYVYSLVWTPDGTRLVTASGDETVRIWDTRTRVASRLSTEPRQHPPDSLER